MFVLKTQDYALFYNQPNDDVQVYHQCYLKSIW